MSIVEERTSKRASIRQPHRDMLIAEEGVEKGSLRKKLMQQIRRVAHGSRNDLKATDSLESTRKEQFSLKQASNVYQEMLLTRSCQLVDQREKSKLIGNAEGFYVEVPKVVDGKVNGAAIELEYKENDKMEYEKEFMPKGTKKYLVRC